MKATPKPIAGIAFIMVFVVAYVLIYNKEQIGTRIAGLFPSTTSISAVFAEQPKDREFRPGSDVKMAGIKVGTVTNIAAPDNYGHSVVTMQIDRDVRDKLHSDPTATMRATLLLGGRYYVDLVPGGQGDFTEQTIPLTRTALPVEVNDLMQAVGTPAAETGIRSSTTQLDGTLRAGGAQALQHLADNAPATLIPADDVLDGLRGAQPGGSDWTDTIAGLQHTAAALTTRTGQTATLISTVNRATAALAAGSPALGDSVATMPETLRTTRAGLVDLQPTLDQLTETGHDFRDSARKLGPFFTKLDPAMARARRLLADARPVLEDAQPLIERLAPATDRATGVFDDLRGEVLDRVNGPILHQVLSPYKGKGAYTGDGADGNKFYEELGFLGVRGAQDFGWHDKVGVVARVGPAFGSQSGGALLPSNEQRLERLGLQRPVGPQADTPGGTKPLSAPTVPFVPHAGSKATPILPQSLDAPRAPDAGLLGGTR